MALVKAASIGDKMTTFYCEECNKKVKKKKKDLTKQVRAWWVLGEEVSYSSRSYELTIKGDGFVVERELRCFRYPKKDNYDKEDKRVLSEKVFKGIDRALAWIKEDAKKYREGDKVQESCMVTVPKEWKWGD